MKPVDEASSYLLSSARWAIENDHFLDDFVRDGTPTLALITKGQYLQLGAPNIVSPGLKPYVFVHSLRTVRKIIARVLRMKEGKRKQYTDHVIAIPESYPGYFEILSEDGRPVKALESVLELCQKFPELCLVRQQCKAYLPESDGELRNQYRSRQVHEGEILTLVGQFNFKRVIFLRCFDEMGASVYLKLSQKGRFSPIARADAITGVHCVANLLNKRMPITVRQIPSRTAIVPNDFGNKLFGNNSAAQQGLVLQLQSVSEEQIVCMYPLMKHQDHNVRLLTVPRNTHLRLTTVVNHSQIRRSTAFGEIQERCDEMLSDCLDKIVSVDSEQYMLSGTSPNSKSPPTSPIELKMERDDQNQPADQSINIQKKRGKSIDRPPKSTQNYNDEEIDQLYDYVRGLAPLPSTCADKTTDKDRPNRVNVQTRAQRKQRSLSNSEPRKHHRRLPQVPPPPPPDQEWQGPTIVEITDDQPDSLSPMSMEDTTSPSSTSKSPPLHYEHRNRSQHERGQATMSSSSNSNTSKSPPAAHHANQPHQYNGNAKRYVSRSTEKLFQQQNHHNINLGHLRPPQAMSAGQRRRPFSMVVPDNVNLLPPHLGPHEFMPAPAPAHLMRHYHNMAMYGGVPPQPPHPSMAYFGPPPTRLYQSSANLSGMSGNNNHNDGGTMRTSSVHSSGTHRPSSPRVFNENNNVSAKGPYVYGPPPPHLQPHPQFVYAPPPMTRFQPMYSTASHY